MSRYSFILLGCSLQVTAQPLPNACQCATVFNETVHKVTTVYAGFSDKVPPKSTRLYTKQVARLRHKAAQATSERACYQVLNQFTSLFQDSHVGIWYSVQSSAAQIRRVKLTHLPVLSPPDQMTPEGIWVSADQKQRYAITKDASRLNQFIAVTLASTDSAWVPGMVKAEIYGYDAKLKRYRGMFYQPNFTGLLDGFTWHGNRLDHWLGPSWYRQEAPPMTQANVVPDQAVRFEILNKDFVYLRMAKFNQPEVNQVDSLLKANQDVIQRTRNFIFDLRGNPGGDASSSDEMIQLIYTNPVIYPAWRYRSSPEYIQSLRAYTRDLLKKDSTNQWAKRRQLFLTQLEQRPGELVSSGDSIIRQFSRVNRYPERVALVTDEGSGSSAEFFVFEGKQSKKVTTFGQNTFGVMDYGEVQNFPLSCGGYVVSVPWGRNGWIDRFRYRIDNVGFAPDVVIASSEADWVRFIQRYWAR